MRAKPFIHFFPCGRSHQTCQEIQNLSRAQVQDMTIWLSQSSNQSQSHIFATTRVSPATVRSLKISWKEMSTRQMSLKQRFKNSSQMILRFIADRQQTTSHFYCRQTIDNHPFFNIYADAMQMMVMMMMTVLMMTTTWPAHAKKRKNQPMRLPRLFGHCPLVGLLCLSLYPLLLL